MNVKFVTRAVGAAKLALKAKAPTLMVVAGITSMGAGAVVACKQTLKVEDVMEDHIPELENIQTAKDLSVRSYTEEVALSDRFRVYSSVALDLGKLYAVPGVLFGGGAALVFGGHRILLRRNATMALAFTSLKTAFDAYRGRVIETWGHDADQAMANGSTTMKVTDEKSGKTAVVQTRDWDESGNDPYNRVFDQFSSQSWQPDLGINKMFISQQQRFAQELLSRRGYLYLSEVYSSLGFAESDISRVVGWKVKRNADGSKDIPFVDFGLDKALPDDWKYGKDKAIFLDFNCQGLIVGGKIQKILEQSNG